MQKFIVLKSILFGIACTTCFPSFIQAEKNENVAVKTPPSVFLLAKNAHNSGNFTEALELYQKKVNMEDNREEVYWSLINMAKIQENLNMPGETIVANYELAFACCPNHAEALYFLGHYYHIKKEHEKASRVLNIALKIPLPVNGSYVERWIYDYGALLDYAISTYWAGFYKESLEACEKILANPSIPQNFRDHTLKNRSFSLDKCIAQETKEGRK